MALTERAWCASGDLNWAFTTIAGLWLDAHSPISYDKMNTVAGAMVMALLEFYRRMAVPYENYKIDQNGDEYPTWLLPELP
jgi:hypothetical protein